MLKLENITLTLGKKTPLERMILQNLTVHVKPGEFVIVMGGNGAGKSTFFNVVSGFMLPDFGNIFIDQNNVTDTNRRAKWVSKVMQDPKIGTMENLTIFENMSFAFKRGQKRGLASCFQKKRMDLFKDKLSLLNMGLENRMNVLVSHLSGGQRQALSLIMAVLQESKILLLDEITAALDPSISEAVMALTHHIVRTQHQTCLMITHNIHHALTYGDRLLILKDGKFLFDYTKEEKIHLTHDDVSRHFA